jgi:peptidoglycan-N-acetylglucosamine deacetylase
MLNKLSIILICLLTGIAPSIAYGQQNTAIKSAQREVAITFDDLPAIELNIETARYVTDNLLRRIRANRIPAIGFVNENKLYDDNKLNAQRVEFLRRWLDAGLELGNHTFSHVSIDQTPLALYKENVIHGETVIKKLLDERGMKLRFFRHPQLRTGPTLEYKSELDRFLAERGYTIAPVTIDNNDYIFSGIYARAKQRGDRATMKRVIDAYLPYMEEIFTFFANLSVASLGYEVKQTLLLHANALNTDTFDELVGMMKRLGYRFISLEEALKDPAYRLPEAQSTRGLSWLHRWMLAKGEKVQPEPVEPEFISRLFRTYH